MNLLGNPKDSNPKDGRIRHAYIILAGLLAFAFSLFWYSPLLFGEIWLRFRNPSANSDPAWMLLAPLRELIVAYLLAYLIIGLRIADWRNSVVLSLFLWLAFHAVGMAGAVIWDHMNWKLASVHAGDWLCKMILMSILLRIWKEEENSVAERPASV